MVASLCAVKCVVKCAVISIKNFGDRYANKQAAGISLYTVT